MDGLLLVNKPRGWSSYDVIRKAKAVLREPQGSDQKLPKIGHAGTLDPLAEGLMLILFGSYCKKAQDFTQMEKVYEAEITLGYNSTTDDADGNLEKVSKDKPSQKVVTEVLGTFKGEILQQPPRYSAIKINGKRAYNLARKGVEFEVPKRKVIIHSVELLNYDYPVVHIRTKVSSGTYIRTLARDMGAKLGVGGYITYLNRLEVGRFSLKSSLKAEAITPQGIEENLIKA